MAGNLNSCIYQGWVRHRRMIPFEHQFRYRLFYLMLDLAELDSVFNTHPLWSTHRPNVAWFRRKDHFGNAHESLCESVRNLVEADGHRRPEGRIRLLTHLRYFGYVINPVSFYFCYDQNEQFRTLVAEVTNTPWGETHCYVIDADQFQTGKPTPKTHHVSPFLPMDLAYGWKGKPPTEKLQLHIDNYQENELVMDVTLSMSKIPINFWNLNRTLLRNPMMTGQVLFRIYWQAILLHWKGARFYPHPAKSNLASTTIEPNLPVQSESLGATNETQS